MCVGMARESHPQKINVKMLTQAMELSRLAIQLPKYIMVCEHWPASVSELLRTLFTSTVMKHTPSKMLPG